MHRLSLPLVGASRGGAGRQLGLEPKRKRACAGVGAERKKTFIGGNSVRTPCSKKHMCTDTLTVEGKESSTGAQVSFWLSV